MNNSLLATLFQALIIRDYWLLTVISVLFEVLEYSLEHQLPNFSECWWDHVSLGLSCHVGLSWVSFVIDHKFCHDIV